MIGKKINFVYMVKNLSMLLIKPIIAAVMLCALCIDTQRTHDVMITSLLGQNDVATSYWRNNDVIIAS